MMNMAQNTIPCRKAFTDTLLECALKDKSIVAVTSDARGSVTLDKFAETLPEQFVEVGIAEQDLVGSAAGLATCGKKVFVCAPACFLSARSLEQIKVDVAYSNTNVKIVGVSGGVSYGSLGYTHHSLHDISVMRSIPGITILLPCDIYQTRKMTEFMAKTEGPVYMRMGRGPVPNVYSQDNAPFEVGKANILLEGDDITIIGTGETVRHALDAGLMLREKNVNARVIDMHTVKPLDTEAILSAAKETGRIITVEEHSIYGGLGAAVSEFVVQNCPVPVKILGLPDEPVITGTSQEVFKYYGIDGEGISRAALEMIYRGKE